MTLRAWVIKHFGGIPKSFADLAWLYRVNPMSPNSLPLADEYRKTAPGSQPNPTPNFSAPISKNRYFERDSRRKYPQIVEFNAQQLKQLPTISGSSNGIQDAKEKKGFLNFKYIYSPGKAKLDPTGSAENPEFSIRSVQ